MLFSILNDVNTFANLWSINFVRSQCFGLVISILTYCKSEGSNFGTQLFLLCSKVLQSQYNRYASILL